MIFKETQSQKLRTIILLHGGGLSWWSLQDSVKLLQNEYHVVTPIIDGCGEDGEETFISIEDSARKLIAYIDANCRGEVFALGGLSIGAQIVLETLSVKPDIAQFAIIESALVCPISGTKLLTVPACKISYGLIRKRWFSKMQAKELCVPEDMFEQYYYDSMRMSKQSLINTIMSNGTYVLKQEIAKAESKVLIIVGEKEITAERKSAEILHKVILDSELFIVPGMKHGEFSLCHANDYVNKIEDFFKAHK